MMEIKGKIGTAIAYANIIEDAAIEQIQRMCDYSFTEDSQIRIMPDVHAGTGCTIGTTMTVKDKVVPNLVGVDIGCGMYTVDLGKWNIDLPKLDAVCHSVPSGMAIWSADSEEIRYFDELAELRCFKRLRNLFKLNCSLGTLGGGNHFIEVDMAANGTKYLVIHSGSRNLGTQVAEYYQKLAIEMHSGKLEYQVERNRLIEEYKKTGRQTELSAALKRIKWDDYKDEIPEDLCWLYGDALEDYLHDVDICQRFAKRNRERIAEVILERTKLHARDAFHTIHNYIDTKEMILRKGAIAAHENERVLIPINMRDGSVLAMGKGNPDWNYSAPHGAGRVLRRKTAKEVLDLDEYKLQMAGVYTTSVCMETIDEAPMAYKSLDDIIGVISDSVNVVEVLRPIYNFKAADPEPAWLKKGETDGKGD